MPSTSPVNGHTLVRDYIDIREAQIGLPLSLQLPLTGSVPIWGRLFKAGLALNLTRCFSLYFCTSVYFKTSEKKTPTNPDKILMKYL
jgi:hypothetical protein